MATEPTASPDTRLAAERTALRRGLSRSRAAAIGVLLIAILLGAAAVMAALRAQKLARESRDRLWETLVSQARAERLSGAVGGRTKALQAIREAAAIRPTADLRNDAIAALALIDLQPIDESPISQHAGLAAFSPDLTYYAFNDGSTNQIQVRRTDNHENVVSFPHQHGQLEQLRFSPDESLLAGTCDCGALQLWSISGKRELWENTDGKPGAHSGGLSFDRGGRRLAVSIPADHQIRIFDTQKRDPIEKINATGVGAIALSPNGDRLAWATSSVLRCVSLTDPDAPAIEFDLSSPASFLRWHPDGERVAIGCSDGEVSLADIDRGTRVRFDQSFATIDGLAFTPDGRHLLSTSWSATTAIWDVNQGTLRLQTTEIDGKRFNRSGQELGFIRPYHSAGRWSFRTNSVYQGLARPLNEDDRLRRLEISSDNRWIIAHGFNEHEQFIWSRKTGRLVHRDRSHIKGSLFTPDDGWLISTTREGIQRRKVLDRETLQLGEPELIYDDNDTFYPLHAGPAGRAWANFYTSQGEGYWIDLESDPPSLRRLVTGLPRERGTASLVESPDGRWAIASFWKHRTSELWDLHTSKKVKQLEPFGGNATFVPNHPLAAVGSRRGLTVWNTDDWTEAAHFPRLSASSTPVGIQTSANGTYLSYMDSQHTITLIEVATLTVAAVINNPGQGYISSHRISDDGQFLLISTGNKIHLWDLLELQKELEVLGLRFGEQLPPIPGKLPNSFDLRAAGMIAAGVLMAALLFGLYIMLYQRRLIRQFDTQYAALEQTQKELMQSEKMTALGTLSAGIAHDFRNLLSVIQLSNGFLQRGVAGDPDLREEVEAIDQAVERGNEVVKSMLGYSSGVEGEGNPTCHPGEVVEGIVSLLSQQFLSGLILQIEVAPDLPLAALPRNGLEQIVLNLLVNASEAMDGHGNLWVRVNQGPPGTAGRTIRPVTLPDNEFLRVEVADDGPGIPPETVERIFEPFFTTKALGVNPGTGLGLATVYKIADRHDLGIRLQSTPDEGCCFEILIPIAQS